MARRKVNQEDNIDKKRKITRKDFKKALQIFQFVLPYRFRFGLGILFLLFSTLTALVFPYLAGEILDAATNQSDYSITEVTLGLFTVLFFQAIFSFFRIYVFAQVSERTMRDIRLALYEKIIALPITFFEKRRVGELTSRLTTDVSQLQNILSFTLAEFFRQIATLILGIGVLLFLSSQLTLLMIGVLPLLLIAAIVFGRFIRKLSKKTQDALANSNVIVEETLQSINAVKTFTNEVFEASRYSKSLENVVNFALKAASYRGFFASFIIFALFGGFVLVLWYGAGLVAEKNLTVGELTSFIIYTAFIGGAAGSLSDMYAQIQKTVGSSERILEILAEKIEVNIPKLKKEKPSPISITGNIAFEKVSFQYPTRKDVEVLKNISFQIDAGQKVALVGYSGAGKSTIIQLINLFYPIEKGQITLDNQNIQNYEITQLRQQIGIVPQEVILFGGTIRENILYGKPEASKDEVIDAAKQAYAWEFIQNFPEGLETIVGERGVKLSGGQKQRIAIARAILKNPKILILDEATSSLDADSEKLVQEALNVLMENRTTIIIAHRLATIRKVDKIFVINDGKLVEEGTHTELSLKEEGIYQNLVKLQFESENV